MKFVAVVLTTMLLLGCEGTFAQDSTVSNPLLGLSIVTGGFLYQATTESIGGTYLYGGLQINRIINPKLSILGIGVLEVAPTTGAWGPTFIVGAELPVGSMFLDLTVLIAKDIGPIRGPWIVGPGVALMFPTKKGGAFGPTFGLNRATTGGPNFMNIGLVLTGPLF